MPAYSIVDTHVHFWSPEILRYPWLEGTPLKRPFLPEDYRSAQGTLEVESLVFVECGGPSDQAVNEAKWVCDLARTDPRIAAIVAHAPLEEGAAVAPVLEELAGLPLVRGVRRLLQGESEPGFCLRPGFVQGVQLLARYDFSFDICIKHWQLADAVTLVRQCPAVSFVLDHIGKPDIKSGLREPWSSWLRELSALPNVVCKVSGMVTEADHNCWSEAELRPYFDTVWDAFGPERVFYGSDWPVATLATEYPRWVAALDSFLTRFSDAEQRAFWRENGSRFYRL